MLRFLEQRIIHATDCHAMGSSSNLPHMIRGVLTGLVSFFLLFMQQESVRHELDHVGARLQRSEHSALELPTGDKCIECDLLAGGVNSIPSAAVLHVINVPPQVAPVAPITRLAVAAPSYYHCRAPPRLLQSA